MNSSRFPALRPTPASSLYVLAVALIGTAGFIVQSPWPILLAALLALPLSFVAMPGYYLAVGLLALIPGANPSSSTGSVTVAPDGSTISVTTGAPAAWFMLTTSLLGILALNLAACLNVLVFRALLARKRASQAVKSQ